MTLSFINYQRPGMKATESGQEPTPMNDNVNCCRSLTTNYVWNLRPV
jgi:hypothetical protein